MATKNAVQKDPNVLGYWMMRRGIVWGLMLASCLATGCRCCCLLNPYANAVDDISDTHVYFDNWYHPRLDISRAGRPDWCGPLNRHFGKQICYMGCYDRYDDCYLYPPSNPYTFPSDTLHDTNALASPAVGPAPIPTPSPMDVAPPPTPGLID